MEKKTEQIIAPVQMERNGIGECAAIPSGEHGEIDRLAAVQNPGKKNGGDGHGCFPFPPYSYFADTPRFLRCQQSFRFLDEQEKITIGETQHFCDHFGKAHRFQCLHQVMEWNRHRQNAQTTHRQDCFRPQIPEGQNPLMPS